MGETTHHDEATSPDEFVRDHGFNLAAADGTAKRRWEPATPGRGFAVTSLRDVQ